MRVSYPPLVGEDFTPVQTDDVANIGQLKVRACKVFSWGAPSSVTLFRVREGRERALAIANDPSLAAGILVNSNKLSADEAVVAGSWLLASAPPPAVAPGACLRRSVEGSVVARTLTPRNSSPHRSRFTLPPSSPTAARGSGQLKVVQDDLTKEGAGRAQAIIAMQVVGGASRAQSQRYTSLKST